MPRLPLRSSLLWLTLAVPALPLLAQTTPAPSAAPSPRISPSISPRILGTVTALAGNAVTVHGDAGDATVNVTPDTRLLRTTPGETSLKNAMPLTLGDLAVGDRILVRTAPDGSASMLVAIKQADISQAHEQASAGWQRGITGVVQLVDAEHGDITLRAPAGAAPLVVHTTPATIIRRYAPDSIAFADTRKAALADIHPGDQLRARGNHAPDNRNDGNASGSPLAAVEIVAGSFRNIAGTVLSIDAAAHTLTLTDLATKRPVTLQLETATQLCKLPPEAAARLAHRGTSPEASGAPAGKAQTSTEHPHEPGEHEVHNSAGDTVAVLQHAPAITLTDLKPGDAVMVVASGPEAKQPVAITVIAGVELLLRGSSDASAGVFSASWNLGGGDTAAAAQ